MIPSLDSLTAKLDEATVRLLGDTTLITPPFGEERAVNAFVDHSEGRRDFGILSATAMDMTVAVRTADVPDRPGDTWRIRLPKVPDKIFRPSDVRLDESATFWTFALSVVK